MSDSRSLPVLILGMHRSGTSYLASRLQALGVDVGQDLVGAQPGNPRGHFEDRDVLRFHESLIASRRGSGGWAFDCEMMVTERLNQPWTAEERTRAEELVAPRLGTALWGWKEPRTALFISQWKQVLPDYRGVVIFRHPLAVHFSALRRRHWDLALFPDQVLRAYANYNQSLIEAIHAEPERYLVVNADAALGDLNRLDAALRDFLPLPEEAPGELPEFHADEFASSVVPPEAHALLRQIAPEAVATYETLSAMARLPAGDANTLGSAKIEGGASLRLPDLSAWSSDRRALLIPLLETLWFEREPLPPSALRRDLGEEIGKKVRDTEEWNRRAEQVYRDNERLDAECTRLGDAFAEQQAFLDRHTKDFAKLWDHHKELGNDWVRQSERVAGQGAHIRTLEALLREAGREPPPLPPECL